MGKEAKITYTGGWCDEYVPKKDIEVSDNQVSISVNAEVIHINKKGLKYLLALIEVKSNE